VFCCGVLPFSAFSTLSCLVTDVVMSVATSLKLAQELIRPAQAWADHQGGGACGVGWLIRPFMSQLGAAGWLVLRALAMATQWG
jgi:hypothetical protein